MSGSKGEGKQKSGATFYRPPFEQGNEVALSHGAYSSRRVDPLAMELLETVLGEEHLAYLDDPAYQHSLLAWARAETRIQLLTDYVEKVGMFDQDGKTTPAFIELQRAESAAVKHRQRLGLDPLSRAQLGKDIASTRLDLARLWADDKKAGA